MDESPTLVRDAEILVGFEFMATFQDGFETLSLRSQNVNGIALTLMLFTLALLFSPAAFHQIAESGEDSFRLHGFATRVMEMALLPFALGTWRERVHSSRRDRWKSYRSWFGFVGGASALAAKVATGSRSPH
jgi:hypothetical protein